MANVPEVINAFNVYTSGNQLIGLSGAVTLPNFEAITEEISGAGILGSYETSIPGFFSSMAQEVPFRVLDDDIFTLMNPSETTELTFRASKQSTVRSTGALEWEGMRVVERGRFKSFKPGKFEMGKQMEASITLELLYILIEINGETILEYDKLNPKFTVNGVDLLAPVTEYT